MSYLLGEILWGAFIIGGVYLSVFAYERSNARPCEQCGERVPLGRWTCRACGFNFRT